MNISELLKLNVPDDTIIKFGDQDVKWGDLKANMLGLSQDRDNARNEANQWKTENGKLSDSVAQLLTAANNAAQQSGGEPASPRDIARAALADLLKEGEEKGDPYLDPIVERKARRLMEDFRKTDLAAISQQFQHQSEQYNKALQLLAGQLGFERTQRQYKELAWPKEMDYVKATKEAIERGYVVPGTQFPDYERFNRDLMAPVKQQETEQRIRDEERRKVEGEFRSAYGANLVMPNNRPGMQIPNGPAPIKTEGKSTEQIFEESLRQGIEDVLKEGNINGFNQQ